MDSQCQTRYARRVSAFRKYDWRKFVVAFLLLWTLVDLAFPGLCRAEGVVAGQAQTTVAAATARVGPGSGDGTQLPYDDDDCFCCCSHVIPGSHMVMSSPELTNRSKIVVAVSEPFALPHTFFHPPRS
jgi:hypothetical protein